MVPSAPPGPSSGSPRPAALPGPEHSTGRRVFVGLTVLVSAAAFLGGAYGFFFGIETAPKAGDEAFVVTAADVAQVAEGFSPQEQTGRLKRTLYLDGSQELRYEYRDSQVYLRNTIHREGDRPEARAFYRALARGVPVGSGLDYESLGVTARDDLLQWGETSRCAIMTSGGAPVGHYFIAIEGERIFLLVLSGIVVDDRAKFSELVLPRLEKLAALPF